MEDSGHYSAPYDSSRPIAISRALMVLGQHVATWRRLQGLKAELLAERAGISRNTLRAIEKGAGGASTENLLRVLNVIGVMDGMVRAVDPFESDVGRLRANEDLPKRVRA